MDFMQLFALSASLAFVFVIGIVLGYTLAWGRARASSDQARIQLAQFSVLEQANQDKLLWAEQAETKMREAFEALAASSLRSATDELLKRANEQTEVLLRQLHGDLGTNKVELQGLVDPLRQNLKDLGDGVSALESKREGAYQAIQSQLRGLEGTNRDLLTTTATLSEALRSQTVRGRWGEFQLRRIIEMANMVKHVDFDEQATVESGRPDMVIHLSNQGILPVDSKAPLQAYLDAIQSPNEDTRRLKMIEHAKAMQSRVRDLAQKKYWSQFQRAPEFVIMFIPNEACLSAAFEADPALLDYAIDQHVLVTSPITLLALLKTIAYGWHQAQITENAREIAELGRELYKRLGGFLDHITELGRIINKSVDEYNKTLSSLQTRVLPSTRKLQEAGLGDSEIATPPSVELRATLPSLGTESVKLLANKQRGKSIGSTIRRKKSSNLNS